MNIDQSIIRWSFQIIREFLIKQNKDWILTEYEKTQNLSEFARQQLIQELCAFVRTFFGEGNVGKPQKTLTAKAALEIFPSMRSQTGPEEVSLTHYNAIHIYIWTIQLILFV